MEQQETFTYTYSAAQQEEIAAIRKKYAAPEAPVPDKMEQLRQLDRSVTRESSIWALSVGILSTLVMGLGMSLIMTELGTMLGITAPLVPGLVTGILGMIGVIAAYPLHQWIARRQRARIAPQILQLAEELSGK